MCIVYSTVSILRPEQLKLKLMVKLISAVCEHVTTTCICVYLCVCVCVCVCVCGVCVCVGGGGGGGGGALPGTSSSF